MGPGRDSGHGRLPGSSGDWRAMGIPDVAHVRLLHASAAPGTRPHSVPLAGAWGALDIRAAPEPRPTAPH